MEGRTKGSATAIESRKRTLLLPLFIPKQKEFAEVRTSANSHSTKSLRDNLPGQMDLAVGGKRR